MINIARYVTKTECDTKCDKLSEKLEGIEKELNGINIKIAEMKIHFNDTLKDNIKKNIVVEKWRFAIVMAILSGIISFTVAFALRGG